MSAPRFIYDGIERMAPRQRDIMRVIHSAGGATVLEIQARIPDPPPSLCGLRTQLNRLAKRGVVRTRPSGRHREILYLPVENSADIQLGAFSKIIEDHFAGSAGQALAALNILAASDFPWGSDVPREPAEA